MTTREPSGHVRDVVINEPGMIGARWWNRSLIAYDKSVSRRKVLKTIAVAGGVALFIGLAVKGISSASSDDSEDVQLQLKKSLDMQRQYGWDFGARGVPLVFDGVKMSPFDRQKLQKLAALMVPRDADHRSFHRGTLTESLVAQPSTSLPDPDGQASFGPKFVPLIDVIVPAESIAMKTAYAAGEAFARLCLASPTSVSALPVPRKTVDGKRLGLLIDMPGAESVAFAAGAAELFEPVMLFDNWPHPRGVVAAHDTLAALAFYQPRFEATAPIERKWPAFMLDRNRVAQYSDASDRFDNRYYARFPSAESLRAKNITQILYVVSRPTSLPEPSDLNEPLSLLASDAVAPAIGARALAASEFSWSSLAPLPPAPTASAATGAASASASASPAASASASVRAPPSAPPLATKSTYYGGKPATDASIWALYPMLESTTPQGTEVTENAATRYRFLKHASASQKEPDNFGVVGVMVAAGSGLIIAAALDRAGSMNRFSGGWSG
ncbi:MAG: hypothetical protein U0414_24490 [Polyangiaceae bacterium]